MPQLVEAHMTLTLDGFGTGVNQRLEAPFGDGVGEDLHRWMFEDRENNKAEIDAIVHYGAFVMGRNMFDPGRGAPNLEWRGWWGPNPPYHKPVFVITHYARPSLEMEGGTVFHFVTDGPEKALDMARQAAGEAPVSIAGGVHTLRHYLNAGAVDRLFLSISPELMHRGERLWDGLTARLEPAAARHSRFATHVEYRPAR